MTQMPAAIEIEVLPQPDDTTCGPTCLHALYRYYNDELPLERVIAETPTLEHGGTRAVWLACHALRRGYAASIYTFNLQVFDPTWFRSPDVNLTERLERQMTAKSAPRLRAASEAYVEFLRLGGQLRMQDLTGTLLRGYLRRGTPILTGLSATYLYGGPREIAASNQPDDVLGEAAGHFVILSGYDQQHRRVLVADPYLRNPRESHYYEVTLERLICSIMLGVLTYDANLLVILPRSCPH
jgi:hypothetical protein